MVAAYRSSTKNATAAATSLTLNKPTGCVAGDVLYMWIATDGIASTDVPFAISGATWVPIGLLDSGKSLRKSATTTLSLWRAICTGSESATFVVTFGTGTDIAAAPSGVCVCVQGADNTTPEDVAAAGNDGGAVASTSVVAPSISPPSADSLLLCAFASDLSIAATAYTIGTMTEREDIATASRTPLMAATQGLVASGATGTRTATANASQEWVAGSVAVRSAVTLVTPTRVTGVASVPSVVGVVTSFPSTVTAVASVPAATAAATTTVTPTRVDAVASVPAAGIGERVFPSRVTGVASVPSPVVLITAGPSRVTGVASVPSPAVTASAGVTVTRVDAVASVPAATPTVGSLITPARVDAVASVPSPLVFLVATVARVDGVASLGVVIINVENATVRTARIDLESASHAVDRFPLPPYDPTRAGLYEATDDIYLELGEGLADHFVIEGTDELVIEGTDVLLIEDDDGDDLLLVEDPDDLLLLVDGTVGGNVHYRPGLVPYNVT